MHIFFVCFLVRMMALWCGRWRWASDAPSSCQGKDSIHFIRYARASFALFRIPFPTAVHILAAYIVYIAPPALHCGFMPVFLWHRIQQEQGIKTGTGGESAISALLISRQGLVLCFHDSAGGYGYGGGNPRSATDAFQGNPILVHVNSFASKKKARGR